MIKNKLESLKGSKFAGFKTSGVLPNTEKPQYIQIPISGSGTHDGSGFSYSGEISTCTGTGTTSVSVGPFSVSNAKEYMYNCDWWATVTYDGYTKTFSGN